VTHCTKQEGTTIFIFCFEKLQFSRKMQKFLPAKKSSRRKTAAFYALK